MPPVILYDYLGREIKLTAKPPTERAGAVPLNQRSLSTSTQFTTPASIKAAWNAARAGDVRTLMQLAQEIETDPHWGGLLRKRRLALTRLPWNVDYPNPDPSPQGGEGSKKLQQIADDVKQMLGRLKLRHALAHLQDAIFKPFAVLEILWDNSGGETKIVGLEKRLGTEFNFDYATTGEQLRLITKAGDTKGEPINPLQFVVRRSHESGSRLMAEGGLARSLGGRWLLKIFALQQWMMWLERDGRPVPIGKYPQGTSDESIRALKTALASIGPDAAMVIQDDMEFELHEGIKNSGRDVFSPFVDKLDRDAAIAIVGNVLSSAGSDQGSGSLALGEVHKEVEDQLIETDAADCSEIISEQLIKPYVIMNYGEQEAYPQFILQAEPEEDVQQALTLLQGAQGLGLGLTAGTVSQRLRIPLGPNQDEEDVLVPVTPGGFYPYNLNPDIVPQYDLNPTPEQAPAGVPNPQSAAARAKIRESFKKKL